MTSLQLCGIPTTQSIKMNLVDLQAACRARKLDDAGMKSDLQRRLADYNPLPAVMLQQPAEPGLCSCGKDLAACGACGHDWAQHQVDPLPSGPGQPAGTSHRLHVRSARALICRGNDRWRKPRGSCLEPANTGCGRWPPATSAARRRGGREEELELLIRTPLRLQKRNELTLLIRKLNTQIEKYMLAPQLDHDDPMSPLEWWSHRKTDFHMLTPLVRNLLAMPGSTAALERSFSHAGLVFAPRRLSLDPKTGSDIISWPSAHSATTPGWWVRGLMDAGCDLAVGFSGASCRQL